MKIEMTMKVSFKRLFKLFLIFFIFVISTYFLFIKFFLLINFNGQNHLVKKEKIYESKNEKIYISFFNDFKRKEEVKKMVLKQWNLKKNYLKNVFTEDIFKKVFQELILQVLIFREKDFKDISKDGLQLSISHGFKFVKNNEQNTTFSYVPHIVLDKDLNIENVEEFYATDIHEIIEISLSSIFF